MKKYVLELLDFELFFFKRNNFSVFSFFSKKMLVANFMRFRRKRLEKKTHIDNFSLKKNPKSTFVAEKKKWQKKFTIFFPYTKIAKQKNSQ